MKTYDFDTWIDRTETTSIKHAFKEEFQVPSDAIPLCRRIRCLRIFQGT